jgi:alanyl-tRNA synthetase
MRHYNLVNGIVNRAANDFKVAMTDLEATITKLREDARSQYKQLNEVQEKLLGYQVAEWVARAVPQATANGEVKLICRLIDRDPAQLRTMAKAIIAYPSTVAALACVTDKTSLCFARAADVNLDARLLLKNALESLDPIARGGGSADFAQGGCVGNDAKRVQTALERIKL